MTRWWPEYRDHPERPTTLRMMLSHTSGKHAFPDAAATIRPTDSEGLRRSLADSPPATTPGTVLVEHAATYGHLVDGVLAAAGAPSIAEGTATLSSALGLRVRFGVPRPEQGVIATLESIAPGWPGSHLEDDAVRRCLEIPRGLLDLDELASPEWRETSFPAIGLVTDARSRCSTTTCIGRTAVSPGSSVQRSTASCSSRRHRATTASSVVRSSGRSGCGSRAARSGWAASEAAAAGMPPGPTTPCRTSLAVSPTTRGRMRWPTPSSPLSPRRPS
ncbi:hypothetical protein B5808_17185 [Cnuibacter physcomitrellae]|uniref:Beta-lactamase-related domain-containing protein n=1 Tax=Cnuibacter physcomitrellae TaxID=1619308 RepID=A0A1X9LNI2_9MICO|nr:hypothetical protein B5808_17185 [Cnuibacter physcomitrellae]